MPYTAVKDDSSVELASLYLTHVYYNPDDHLSLLCAYLALLPQALMVVYATLLLSTREIEIALMFAGQVGCEAINFALKRLIKEERPYRIHGTGYAMPSSHAQFVAYWSVSLTLFFLVRHKPQIIGSGSGSGSSTSSSFNDRPWSFIERLALSVLVCVVAAATAWSRLYLNYHTPKQVIVGVVAGVCIAVGWFVVTSVLRQTGWLAWGLDTTIARFFRLRDLISTEDMVQAGWEKWELKRAVAAQGKVKTK